MLRSRALQEEGQRQCECQKLLRLMIAMQLQHQQDAQQRLCTFIYDTESKGREALVHWICEVLVWHLESSSFKFAYCRFALTLSLS